MSATTPTSSWQGEKIFINYRREDASGYAGRLYEWLSDRFGSDRVFMDIRAIGPGTDFITAIETEVAACGVVLVIIGSQWLESGVDGQSRLDNPNDFVRLEIASALSRNILVIPVLVEGAAMPREQDLPDDLKPLARRNALEVSDARWEFDVGRLIESLEERLENKSAGEVARRRVKESAPGGRNLRRYWQLLPVRVALGLLVLAGALLPQLYLIFRPEAVNLRESGRFSQATAMLGREELIIEGPVTNSEEGLLLSHLGQPDEVADFSFDRARLDGETLLQLSDYNPPTNPTRIDYQTAPSEERAEGEPCRTFIDVKLADPKKPLAALRFSQLGAPGANISRRLDVKATGGELIVKIDTSMPDDGTERAPGCRKNLVLGSPPQASLPTEGTYSVAVVAEADAAAHFSFNPASAKNSLWKDSDGLFEPFGLGVERMSQDAAPPFRARAIEIRNLGDKSSPTTPVLSVRSLEGGELLNVESLKVGSDRIQLNVSGTGMVKQGGKDYIDLFDRVKRHPLAAALLAVIDAALVVWFMLLIFKRREPMLR